MAWGDGLEAGGPDDLAIVGYLEIGAGSSGVISLTVDPRRGTATYVDPEQFTYEIATSRLGRADVDGNGGGVSHCAAEAGGFEGDAPADGDALPSLSVHMSQGLITTCPDTLACADMVAETDSTGMQTIYVVASGVTQLKGVSFGISYTDSLDVVSWTSCRSGTQAIAENGWPASGTAISLVFPEQSPSSADSLVTLGYFLISSGSSGYFSVTADQRVGEALWLDGSGGSHSFDPRALGRGVLGTDVDGLDVCGAFDEPTVMPTATYFQMSNLARSTGDPVWGYHMPSAPTPVAVGQATTTDENLSEFAGSAVAYVADDSTYHVGRFPRDGSAPVWYSFGSETVVDTTYNRKSQLALSITGGDAGTAREGWSFHAASGTEDSTDTNGGYTMMFRATTVEGTPGWSVGATQNGNANEEVTVGGVALSANENSAIFAGKSFAFNQDPGRFRFCERDAGDGASVGCRLLGLGSGRIKDVIALEHIFVSTDFYYALATDDEQPSPDGFRLVLSDASDDYREDWNVSIDTSDDEEAAVLATDSSGNAIVAFRSEKTGGTSVITLTKYAFASGSEVWSRSGTASGAGSMEVADLVLDSSDNIYLAGRYAAKPGLRAFSSNPTSFSDTLWTYSFPDSGSTVGLARAVAIDDDEEVLYLTGESDEPGDGAGELQMIVSALNLSTGVVDYEHFVALEDVPSEPTASAAGGYSIDVGTDEFGYYVYVLGRLTDYGADPSGSPTTVLFRFPAGESATSPVSTPEIVQSSTTAFWSVRGGRSVDVQFAHVLEHAVTIEVFDVRGRLAGVETAPEGAESLRIDELSTGVYFLRATGVGVPAAVAKALVLR